MVTAAHTDQSYRRIYSRLPLASCGIACVAAGLLLVTFVLWPVETRAQDGKPPRDDEQKLPKFVDMQLPSAEQLQEQPVDWVRLKTDEVIVSEPVYPRPNTLEKLEEEIDALRRKPRPVGEEEIDKRRREREALDYINIVLPNDTETPEFRLHTRHVKEIVYHEDLVLRRLDERLKAEDLSTAYQLLLHLEFRAPQWKGVDRRRNDMLFAESVAQRKAKQPAAALVYLEQLHQRDASYPELNASLGEITNELVQASLEKSDYRRARHYLGRLQTLDSQHPVYLKFRDDLSKTAQTHLQAAKTSRAEGQHAEAAAMALKAAETWPLSPGLSELYRSTTRRWQTLNVGVLRLPGETATDPFFLKTHADRRTEHLTQATLFEIGRFDGRPIYRTRFFEQWLPTDLGRQLDFRLRGGRDSWESRPQVTSALLVGSLVQRLDEKSPYYNERLAEVVSRMSIRSPRQFSVQLSHVIPRTEAFLNFPVRDVRRPGADGRFPVLSERFRLVDRSENTATYQRAVPQADGLPQDAYHIAEVVEQRYTDYEQAIRDFARGRLSMLTPVPHTELPRFRRSGQYSLHKLALPVTHVLQFNPRRAELRNRELRRSLAYALNRETILKETLLKDVDEPVGRVVTAPFPSAHEAYDGELPPRPQDLTLSVALRLASKKALKQDLTRLKMVCDPAPKIVAAAKRMIDDWKRVGLEVELLTADTGQVPMDSDQWDIIYRTVQMPEPLTQLWPFLTFDPQVRVESLRSWPDWLRQELIALETAGDQKTANEQVSRLQRLLVEEVMYIPLWEIDIYSAFRPEVKNVSAESVSEYQDIELWTLETKLPPLWP